MKQQPQQPSVQPLSQVAGIDVAKKELVVCLGRLGPDLKKELYLHGNFANSDAGIAQLCRWVAAHTTAAVPVHYVMEATGVYHQRLAYRLDEAGARLSVVLPTRINSYYQILHLRQINDKTSSETIALFGLDQAPEAWHRPAPVYNQLRQLVREREQLIGERTMVKNQLEAETHEAVPNQHSIDRMEKRISLLKAQEAEIEQEIGCIVSADAGLREETRRLVTIPGVGVLTAVTVLAETNGFELIGNKKQLVSYAGLDVTQKQSGTSVNARAAISKRGNRMLRKCLHYPALSAIRHNPHQKALFARLVSRHGVKMKAVVAVQRKLLELIFTLYKTKRDYDPEYIPKNKSGQPESHPEQACTKAALEPQN